MATGNGQMLDFCCHSCFSKLSNGERYLYTLLLHCPLHSRTPKFVRLHTQRGQPASSCCASDSWLQLQLLGDREPRFKLVVSCRLRHGMHAEAELADTNVRVAEYESSWWALSNKELSESSVARARQWRAEDYGTAREPSRCRFIFCSPLKSAMQLYFYRSLLIQQWIIFCWRGII